MTGSPADRLTRAAVALHGEADEQRCLAALRCDTAIDLLKAVLPTPTAAEVEDGSRRVPSRIDIVAEVHVTVPVQTLLDVSSSQPGHLRGYGPIDPVTARRLTAKAPSLYRILTHPETGVVLSVGRDRYVVPAALRRYLDARDERCRFPGCSRPAHLCDIDHVRPWVEGGTTDHDNLMNLCRRHHRLKDHGWAGRIDPDASVHWTSPWGRHRTTRPHLDTTRMGRAA